MSLDTATAILARMSFPPGWEREVYSFEHGVTLRLSFWTVDAEHKRGGRFQVQLSEAIHDWDFRHLDESGFVRRVTALAVRLHMHELFEWLRLDGKPLENPHPEPAL